METVELQGLKYDPVLQDPNSAFYIVLSSVLKNRVSTDCHHYERRMFTLKCAAAS